MEELVKEFVNCFNLLKLSPELPDLGNGDLVRAALGLMELARFNAPEEDDKEIPKNPFAANPADVPLKDVSGIPKKVFSIDQQMRAFMGQHNINEAELVNKNNPTVSEI